MGVDLKRSISILGEDKRVSKQINSYGWVDLTKQTSLSPFAHPSYCSYFTWIPFVFLMVSITACVSTWAFSCINSGRL